MLLGKEKTSSNLKPGDGKIIIQDHIIRFVLQYQMDEMYSQRQLIVCYIGLTIFFSRFDKVPLVTPNGDVLLQEMSFEVN